MNDKYPEKYPEKNPNYSPSISYNYSPQAGYNGNSQMNPRRRNDRNDRFRRESLNPNERVIRQNDIIIRLLKEIRDRLPAPHYAPQAEAEVSEQSNDIHTAPEQCDKDESVRDGAAPEKVEEPPDDVKNPRMSGPNEDTF
jgi:hypothetical protein